MLLPFNEKVKHTSCGSLPAKKKQRKAFRLLCSETDLKNTSPIFNFFTIYIFFPSHIRGLQIYLIVWILIFANQRCSRNKLLVNVKSGILKFRLVTFALLKNQYRYGQVSCPWSQQANLKACSPQPLLNAEQQVDKLWMPFFNFFWYNSTRGMNSRSTDCEVDALTTTPSRLLQNFLQNQLRARARFLSTYDYLSS